MGLPVTVYRWDDPGAPQVVNTTPSEWINVLKKVLVTGYGTKAGAGWSIAFEDAAAFKVAFRNSTATVGGVTGSGGFVQFWSGNGADTVAAPFLYKGACGMNALDGFIRPGYTELMKGTTVQTNNKQWMIIATSVSFYFIILVNNVTVNTGKSSYSIFVGDIDSFIPGDASRFVAAAGQTADRLTDTSITPLTQSLFGANDRLRFTPRLYQTDGSNTFAMGLCAEYAFVGVAGVNGSEVDNSVVLSLFECVIVTAPTTLDSAGASTMVSQLQPFCRGKLPGMKYALYKGHSGVNFPYQKTINGASHMLMPSQGLMLSNWWLDITEWYK